MLEVADLITQCNLYVVGEHIIRVRHNLLGVPGASTENVREVYSHPQAISQCRDFLRHHSEINAYPYANTALAAKFVAETHDPAKASIGSLRRAGCRWKPLRDRVSLQQNLRRALGSQTGRR